MSRNTVVGILFLDLLQYFVVLNGKMVATKNYGDMVLCCM